MKIISFLENRVSCLLLLAFLFVNQEAVSQSKYVKQYQPIADSLSAVYGIPSSVILGVAIIESGAGKSRNCKLLNNHLGIKGKNNLLKRKGIRTAYKQYPDGRASYIGFCKLLSRRKFYPKLKGKMDYKLWLDAISKSNYSTVPHEWKKNITATIKKHKLYELDEG